MRARAVALASVVVLAGAAAAPAAATGPSDGEAVTGAWVGPRAGAATVRTDAGSPPPDPERDPVGALRWELERAEDPEGFLLVLADATPLEQLWSVLTTLRPVDVQARAADLVADEDGRVERSFERVGQVLADLDAVAAARLAAHPAVRSVSPNIRVRAGVRVSEAQTDATFIPTGLEMLDAASNASLLDDEYRWTSDGTGVDVYVFDTGIQGDHPDVAARIGTEPSEEWFRIDAEEAPLVDCNGHGTHVAGTIAGRLSGVAKGATLYPVKVFPDCALGGFVSDIIDGVEWLEGQYPVEGVDRPIVVNMSLGAAGNASLDAAVQRLVNDGVHVVVAAGNDAVDVSGVSPARMADVLTVGATGFVSGGTNFVRTEAAYSNYGAGVDIFALGTGVASACSPSNRLDDGDQLACTDVSVDGVTHPLVAISGTSMAAPHVAGAVARLVGAAWAADGSLVTPAAAATTLTGGALDTVELITPGAPASWSRLLLNTRVLEPDPPSGSDPAPYPVVAPCTGGSSASALGQLVGGAAPHTWQLTSGTLPGTLSLSSAGLLGGAGSGGTGTGTLVVTDAFGRSASWTVDLSRFPPGCP